MPPAAAAAATVPAAPTVPGGGSDPDGVSAHGRGAGEESNESSEPVYHGMASVIAKAFEVASSIWRNYKTN